MSDGRKRKFDQSRVEVTINGDVVRAPAWARWKDAVTAWRPEIGATIAGGGVRLVDANGEPIDPDGRVVDGAGIQVTTEKEKLTG